MTAYLRYRLDRASVRQLRRVWVLDAHGDWLVRDLAGEMEKLYPGVQVAASSLPAAGGCDLALVPYDERLDQVAWPRRMVREVARSSPEWVGLYEIRRRRILIVRRRRVQRLLLRLTAIGWLREIRWFMARARRRLSGIVGREEVTP